MKKYNIIYADPPWNYKVWSEKGKGRSADRHYEIMTIQDLRNLDVSSIANKDCALFLWVTFPLLKEGIDVAENWGFTYKTCAFNWFKANKKSNSLFTGMGYWVRANSELCLLFTKGKPKRVDASVKQVVWEEEQLLSRRGKHSEKPSIVRNKIVKLMGDIPRIELFARQETEGWDCIGDEINYTVEEFIKLNKKEEINE